MFGFRFRFLSHGPAVDSDAEQLDIKLSDGVTVKFAPTWPKTKLRDARDLKLSARGFTSRDEARVCGERLRNAVLKSMADLRTGFDVGKDRPTSQLSNDLKEAMFQHGGVRMHDNVHGLYVFDEEPTPRFFLAYGNASVSSPADRFVEVWRRQYDANLRLNAKETLALELYALAHAEPSTRARFVALATVVEALAAGTYRSTVAQDLVEKFLKTFIADAKASTLDPTERDSFASSLSNLKRESIGGSCRKYIQDVLGKAESDEFKRLYNIRSTLVHTGVYDATELGDEVTKLDALVSRLLQPLGTTASSSAVNS